MIDSLSASDSAEYKRAQYRYLHLQARALFASARAERLIGSPHHASTIEQARTYRNMARAVRGTT